MSLVIRYVSAVVVILAGAWIYAAPGFESIITCGTSFLAFLATFIVSPVSRQSVSPAISLSAGAAAILAEIDVCTEGAKGLTISLSEPMLGMYRPYLNTSFYDPPGGATISDVSGVLAAASELEDAGFLVLQHATDKERLYTRTAKQA